MALLVDTLGTGMWLPIGLIFFTRAQHIPLAQVGPALTIGGLVGLLIGPVGGTLVDRWGPARLVLLSTAARVVVFALYPAVGAAWQVAVLAALFSACDRLFWTANTPMAAQFTENLSSEAAVQVPRGLPPQSRRPGQGRALDRTISTQNVVRIVGLGAGAGLSGLLAGNLAGLHWLAYLNAASYLVASVVIVASVRLRRQATSATERTVGWRDVLADRPFMLFCGIQVLYALSALSLVVILPVVALSTFGGPAWLPGVSILLGNVALALAQKPAIRLVGRTSRLRGLVLASATFAVTFVLLAFGTYVGRGWVVPLVLAASAFGVVGEALFGPLMVAAANDAAPPSLEGRYSALFQTAWGLATVLAPALFTSLLVVGNEALWSVLAVLALLAVPALRVVGTRLPHAVLR